MFVVKSAEASLSHTASTVNNKYSNQSYLLSLWDERMSYNCQVRWLLYTDIHHSDWTTHSSTVHHSISYRNSRLDFYQPICPQPEGISAARFFTSLISWWRLNVSKYSSYFCRSHGSHNRQRLNQWETKKWTNCEHYHGIREWHKTTWPLAEVQNISQGSVVTRSRCAGIFNDDLITSWNDGKRIMKTAQHLTSYRQEHLHLFWPRVANGPITPITAMTLRWKCQRCWCFPNSSSISW